MTITRPPNGTGFLAVVRTSTGGSRTIARRERCEPPTDDPASALLSRWADSNASIRASLDDEEDILDGWAITPSGNLDLGSIDLP